MYRWYVKYAKPLLVLRKICLLKVHAFRSVDGDARFLHKGTKQMISKSQALPGTEWICKEGSYNSTKIVVIDSVDLKMDTFKYHYKGETKVKEKSFSDFVADAYPPGTKFSAQTSKTPATKLPSPAIPHAKAAQVDTSSYSAGSKWIGTKEPMKVGATCAITKCFDGDVFYRYENENQVSKKPFYQFKDCTEPFKYIVKPSAEQVKVAKIAACAHPRTDWYGDQEYCLDCGDDLRKIQNNPYGKDPDLNKFGTHNKYV